MFFCCCHGNRLMAAIAELFILCLSDFFDVPHSVNSFIPPKISCVHFVELTTSVYIVISHALYDSLHILHTLSEFLAATKQLSEWSCLPVCLSVTPFLLCSTNQITFIFWDMVVHDIRFVHAKFQCPR